MAEKPEDLALPLAVISRIINEAIPPNTVVSAEARRVLGKTASVFILYTTATAGSMGSKHGRKTMNANDVIEAIKEMEFPQFVEPLTKSLQHFRDLQQKKKENTANRKSEDMNKDKASASSPSTSTNRSPVTNKKKSPQTKQDATIDEVVNISSDSET